MCKQLVKNRKLEVQVWYDLCCSKCGRHASTDFNLCLDNTIEGLIKVGLEDGWKKCEEGNICPICVKEK